MQLVLRKAVPQMYLNTSKEVLFFDICYVEV